MEIGEVLAELDLMKNMKPHENILNLLGQCTTPGVILHYEVFLCTVLFSSANTFIHTVKNVQCCIHQVLKALSAYA